MKQIRHQTGAVGSQKEKLHVGDGLRKIEADYYAARVLERRKETKSPETRKIALKKATREKSDLTKEIVANIRWLKEEAFWPISKIASQYGLDYKRVDLQSRYCTWCDIDPCKDGIDFA